MVALPEQPTVVDLEVTSEFFPGRTFTGTAEAIYHEMKALNPASVGNLTFDEPAESNRALARRSTVSVPLTSMRHDVDVHTSSTAAGAPK